MKLHPSDKELIEFVEEDYNQYPDSVKRYISNKALSYMNNLMSEVDTCESPIEYLLGIAMNVLFPKSIHYLVDDYFINPQENIECGTKRYRVDFLIVIRRDGQIHSFVVECDGHDFHEKTKEQAKKDKKRDRDLLLKGYPVIRFTGSEIFENPDNCAREVVNLIISYLEG